ncbi:MAG: hypothetical protein APR63_14075 [Desulfuromonas sp. SDB]|nr:MAG: hypothetical protein APR63_14075 [Desulfuromonas sp. SDB]
MSNIDLSDVVVFSLFTTVLIGLSLFLAGCVQNSPLPAQDTPSPVPETTLLPITTHIDLSTNPQTGLNRTTVNITIESVLRSKWIHGARLKDSIVFIVVNLTIENHNKSDYEFSPSRIKLNGGSPDTRTPPPLDTPVSWGTVHSGETLRGEVVFRVPKVTQILVLNITGTQGEMLFSKELNEGPLIGYDTSKSEKLRALMLNTNFTDVIRQLDTPLLAAQYTSEKFKFFDDNSCKGYTPQEFFVAKQGDCSDFSGFFAYALAAHGYDAKKISFKYYNNEGSFRGHVVAVFTEKDGQLRYATIPDLTQFRNISSLDDMINHEKIRLEFKEIVGDYKIHNPEATDLCHYKSLSEIPTQNKTSS